MNQTIIITTKSVADQLNKWHFTNHNPFEVRSTNNPEIIESFLHGILPVKAVKKGIRRSSGFRARAK